MTLTESTIILTAAILHAQRGAESGLGETSTIDYDIEIAKHIVRRVTLPGSYAAGTPL